MMEVGSRRLSESTSSEPNVEGDAKSIGSVAEPCVVNNCENADEEDEKDPLSVEKESGRQSVEVIEDPERLTPKSEDEVDGGGDGDNFRNAMVIVNDQDPMDLLMPLNPSNRYNDGDTEDDSDGDIGATDRMTKEQLWELWMSKYRWLLHEPCNGDFGYCLYCDVTLHIVSFKSIKQHGISLYHQEREENYLAFKESGEALGDSPSIVEIKQEYGIDSIVAAMKYQRISQTESLNNCNWIRWMHDHSWLVRKQDEGTIGFCNYCKTSLNVEFLYLRKRHETSKGHREAERNYRSGEGFEQTEDFNRNDNSAASDTDEATTSHSVGKDKQNKMKVEPKNKTRPFYELVPRTSLACCKLCNIRVGKQNYRRHLNTKMHLANLREFDEGRKLVKKQESSEESPFAQYTKKHPWLTADPNDPKVGYCTVCQRRFKYGQSEVKLTLHENSSPHKNALLGLTSNNENYANSEGGDDNIQSDDSKSTKSDEGKNKDVNASFFNENNESDEGDGANTISKSEETPTATRVARGSREWFANKEFPWCKPDPKDRRCMICIYCQVSLVMTTKRWSHARSLRHIAAEKKIRSGKSSKRSSHFQWLHYSRNKMPCCRICRVRFPNEQSKIRHEHSERHRELIKEYLKNKVIKKTQLKQQISEDTASETSSQVEPTSLTKPEPNSEAGSATVAPEKAYRKSIQAIVLQYKSRYPWLSYKRSETRPNYAWCEVCEVSFFVPSIKLASKHQRASRHLRALKEKKRVAEGKSPIKTQETIDDIQERYPWLEVEDDEKYCRCRICDIRLPMKVLYRRQHDGSKRHLENMAKQANTAPDTICEDNAADNVGEAENNDSQMEVNANEPVCLLVEDNDEVLSIKSELSADGDENINGDSQDKDFIDLMTPPAKRLRTSNGFQENPVRSARKKMVHIMRNLKRKGRRCSSPFSLAEGILSSSFSIAACLTPLMQQQQQALTDGTTPMPIRPQSSDDIPTSTPPPSTRRDTIDLFLESIGQTLKSLPIDLVAEGKMKIMQIIYDLELRAMQRQTGGNNMGKRINRFSDQSNSPGTTTVIPTELEQTVNGPTASSTVVAASSTSLIRSDRSTPSTISTNEDEAVVENECAMNGVEDIIFVSQQSSLPTISNTSSINTNQTTTSSTPNQGQIHLTNGVVTLTASNSRNIDAALNANATAFKPINTSVQISAMNESGRVRCVPLNALTGGMKRKQQKQIQSYQPTQHPVRFDLEKRQLTITGPHSALGSNGTGTTSNNSLRHIRVNTSTQSKYITIKPVTTGGSTIQQIRSNSIAPTAVTSSISGVITSQNQLNNNTSLQIRSAPK